MEGAGVDYIGNQFLYNLQLQEICMTKWDKGNMELYFVVLNGQYGEWFISLSFIV